VTEPVVGPIRVLVADDVRPIRLALVGALEEEGYSVAAAEDGERAMTIFRMFSPNIALLDLRMPKMDGVDVCRAIRTTSTIPVIMFSALEEQSEKLAAFAAGADDYVMKGTGIEELMARMAASLKWARLRRDDPKPQGPGMSGRGPAYRPGQRASHSSPSVLVVDADAENRSAVAQLVEQIGCRPITAGDGLGALALILQYSPKAVILDLNMPAFDGFEFLKAVRSNESTASVPVLVLSGRALPADIASARALGVSEYILKPWSHADLEVRLTRTLLRAAEASDRNSA